MGIYKVLDGNDAAAHGVALSKPDVMAIFPITPNTTLINGLAEMHARGELKCQNVTVENEHAALSVVAGAAAAGARTFTASASQGVVHMEEVLWMIPGNRLPLVMAICNRSIAFPGGLQCTHSDSLLQRDNGWLQLYCETAQETLDTTIQSYKIAEDKRVLLPTHYCLDGYVLSANASPVDIPEENEVDDFLPKYKPDHFYLDPTVVSDLAPGNPSYRGFETEIRYQIEEAQERAKSVIKEVNAEFAKKFGRSYGNGLIDEYRTEDAKGVLITMGSMTGTARVVVDQMREEGKSIGLVKLRSFRPFPTEDLKEIGKKVEAIGFVDRNFSHGGAAGGAIGAIETSRALYHLDERPPLLGFVAGIGGRDVTYDNFRYMANKVLKTAETKKVEKEVEWIQLMR
ncbi:MAG: transketolase C-terminal domain-containing protein [Promethearchaeota archaeon]